MQSILGQEIGAQRESVRAWLAQSDSGQPIVIQGTGSNRPSAPDPANTKKDSPIAFAQASAPADDPPPPSTRIEAGKQGRSNPPAALAASDAAPLTDRQPPGFEVAADVTMRFALESAKQELPPPPSSPPPSSARIVPPRVPPPKQSSPTLLGQGPVAQQLSDAARAAINGTSQKAFDALLAEANAQPPTLREMPEGAPSAAVPSSKPDSGMARALDRAADQVAAGGYVPQVTDDLEDAITVARPGHGVPSVIQPQVKTQRGLVAEPLLAAAQAQAARADANGSNGQASVSTMSVVKTPRMPMPIDQSGVDQKAHANAGAAIIAGVPEAQPLAPGARHPRTLVSASPMAVPGQPISVAPPSAGEVSNGGFTPSSMTLPSEHAAFHNDALDPTVVHSLPKRRVGKVAVVLAAFLLVFGAGLLLLKARSDGEAAKEVEKPKAAAAKETATATAKATAVPTATATAEPSATAVASSEPSATTTAKTATGPIRKGGPRVEKTSKPTATSEPTSKPKDPGEDLSNPYR
ncbi:MAG: hypothetical protein JNK04_03760 [Myxococcales bacterium]|nr:hypothetical protein [Myxococcales bacterium]